MKKFTRRYTTATMKKLTRKSTPVKKDEDIFEEAYQTFLKEELNVDEKPVEEKIEEPVEEKEEVVEEKPKKRTKKEKVVDETPVQETTTEE